MGKCPTFHLLGGQLSSGQLSGGQLSGGQLSGGQLSVPRHFEQGVPWDIYVDPGFLCKGLVLYGGVLSERYIW